MQILRMRRYKAVDWSSTKLSVRLVTAGSYPRYTSARLVTKTKKHDHITPVLIQLHWLPVEFRIQYKLIIFAFKALHGKAPKYISEFVQEYVPSRSLRSESSNQLIVPRVRTRTYGDRRFDKASATLWNSLPMQLRKTDCLTSFKKDLKTFLFKSAYHV